MRVSFRILRTSQIEFEGLRRRSRLAEEYVVRDDEVGLMHDVPIGTTLEDLIDAEIIKVAQLGGWYATELQNLIDYVIYPHTHEEITIYAMALKHRLEEK